MRWDRTFREHPNFLNNPYARIGDALYRVGVLTSDNYEFYGEDALIKHHIFLVYRYGYGV